MTTTPPPRRLILASGSPRRRELLGLTGLDFEILRVDIDESVRAGETARSYTARLSREKADAALALVSGPALILTADTTVADGDNILGKPENPAEARAMLHRLRGRAHQVYTALSLVDAATGARVTEIAVTDVPMRDYSDEEIDAYIASGDPFDKAGGYAIQNTSFRPADLRSGCYANVVGLPLCHLLRALRRFDVTLAETEIARRCQHHHAYTCDVTDAILTGTD